MEPPHHVAAVAVAVADKRKKPSLTFYHRGRDAPIMSGEEIEDRRPHYTNSEISIPVLPRIKSGGENIIVKKEDYENVAIKEEPDTENNISWSKDYDTIAPQGNRVRLHNDPAINHVCNGLNAFRLNPGVTANPSRREYDQHDICNYQTQRSNEYPFRRRDYHHTSHINSTHSNDGYLYRRGDEQQYPYDYPAQRGIEYQSRREDDHDYPQISLIKNNNEYPPSRIGDDQYYPRINPMQSNMEYSPKSEDDQYRPRANSIHTIIEYPTRKEDEQYSPRVDPIQSNIEHQSKIEDDRYIPHTYSKHGCYGHSIHYSPPICKEQITPSKVSKPKINNKPETATGSRTTGRIGVIGAQGSQPAIKVKISKIKKTYNHKFYSNIDFKESKFSVLMAEAQYARIPARKVRLKQVIISTNGVTKIKYDL